ncbi:MAG: 2OG-Fe(II) oxygenase [Alphaproteobacteria bacterium]
MSHAEDQKSRPGLDIGERMPNFSLPDDAGQAFLFYEFAVGDPVILLAHGAQTDEDTVREDLHRLNAWWSAGQQAVLIALRPGEVIANARLAEELALFFPLLTDGKGDLIAQAFGTPLDAGEGLFALILDRNLRVLERVEPGRTVEAVFEGLADDLARRAAAPDVTAAMTAPVLIVPDVIPELIRRMLMDRFEGWDPQASPMPTLDDGALSTALDQTAKDRMDVVLKDKAVTQALTALIAKRVLPEIYKAFWYRVTRFETLKLVRYGARTGGYFKAHRDNTAPDTAHRRFALTINLNTDDYRGGGLVFPEYGPTVYAPAPGGAVVFSGAHAHEVLPVTDGNRFALISFLSGEDGTRPAAPAASPAD